MEGRRMAAGERYLFRLRGKQIPVTYEGMFEKIPVLIFDSEVPKGRMFLKMIRLDTGEEIYRKTARALSKHFDDCALIRRDGCDCVRRLREVAA